MNPAPGRPLMLQDPRIGRFLQEHFAFFFIPACLNDEAGCAVYWNPHAERISGIPAQEALGRCSYTRLLPDGERPVPAPAAGPDISLLDLFLAGRLDEIQARYGREHVFPDRRSNLMVLDCAAGTDCPAEGRLLLCGRWQDQSGKNFSYFAWSWLADYDFTASPSVPLYNLLKGLDRKRSAWFGIQQDELYGYLSPGFIRALFDRDIPMEELLGSPMRQTMTPAAAQDHARTIAALTPEKSAETVLNWPLVAGAERKSWVQTYPNILVVNGAQANFSLVLDVTAEKERDSTLENLLAASRAERTEAPAQDLLATFAGRSQIMRDTLETLLRASLSLVTAAIYGETGTGKSLAARLIHQLGSRADGPFVSVNCGAIPEDLFESAFFGHVKGSFTGAIADKIGLLTRANTGTLFLDEIAELSPRSQARLLQALSEKSYTPVGSTEALHSKFRLIVATNRDLEEMVRLGTFREDLLYRVNVLDMRLPPLRERKEDIPLLLNGILRRHGLSEDFASVVLAPEAIHRLEAHDWPGNIRELENVILRCTAEGNLNFFQPTGVRWTPPVPDAPELGGTLKERLARQEHEILLQCLTKHRWRRDKVAEELGISRATLFRKMREMDLR